MDWQARVLSDVIVVAKSILVESFFNTLVSTSFRAA